MQKNIADQLIVDNYDYQQKINEPVDDDYTASNKYESRLWVEKYKTPDITYKENGETKVNPDAYLNDRIIDNLKTIDSVNANNYQLKQEKYKKDLYAFAASMKNEVYRDMNGINMRSFYQFCTRIHDKNNEAFNNLVEAGYFSSKNIDEINIGSFCLSAANEVFSVNMVTAAQKDTEEVSYSRIYSTSFDDDIKKKDQVNIDNQEKYAKEINYYDYADREETRQLNEFKIENEFTPYKDSERKFVNNNYTIYATKHFHMLEKKPTQEELFNQEYAQNTSSWKDKLAESRTREIQSMIDELNGPAPKKNQEIENVEPEELDEENEPIEVDDFLRKRIDKQVKDFIKEIVKGSYDTQKNVPDELKNTTAAFALGIKGAFEDYPKFKNLPEDVRKKAAAEFKNNLDKNIDGEKQAAQSLKEFYSNLHYDRNNLDKNNPRNVEMLQNMRNDGLHVDALSSYFRLTEIHEKRNGLFWLFHPIQNKAEKAAINEMKDVLKSDFGLNDKDLDPYYIDKNGNKKLNSPKQGDAMVDEILNTCVPKVAKKLANQKEMRNDQIEYYKTLADSPENAEMLKDSQVKFKIDDIYPELYGINNLSKSSVNKEKTVEKGMNK